MESRAIDLAFLSLIFGLESQFKGMMRAVGMFLFSPLGLFILKMQQCAE